MSPTHQYQERPTSVQKVVNTIKFGPMILGGVFYTIILFWTKIVLTSYIGNYFDKKPLAELQKDWQDEKKYSSLIRGALSLEPKLLEGVSWIGTVMVYLALIVVCFNSGKRQTSTVHGSSLVLQVITILLGIFFGATRIGILTERRGDDAFFFGSQAMKDAGKRQSQTDIAWGALGAMDLGMAGCFFFTFLCDLFLAGYNVQRKIREKAQREGSEEEKSAV